MMECSTIIHNHPHVQATEFCSYQLLVCTQMSRWRFSLDSLKPRKLLQPSLRGLRESRLVKVHLSQPLPLDTKTGKITISVFSSAPYSLTRYAKEVQTNPISTRNHDHLTLPKQKENFNKNQKKKNQNTPRYLSNLQPEKSDTQSFHKGLSLLPSFLIFAFSALYHALNINDAVAPNNNIPTLTQCPVGYPPACSSFRYIHTPTICPGAPKLTFRAIANPVALVECRFPLNHPSKGAMHANEPEQARMKQP